MKKTLLSFFIFFLTNNLFAQPSWLFSAGAGSLNAENAKSVYVDVAGNVYVTGSFSNTVDFDLGTGTANLTSAGSNDIFIASYTSAGVYRWAVRAGGTANDNATPAGAIISDGTNLYVAGAYNGANTAFGSITISPAGGSGTDAFFAKMNPTNGAFIWVNSLGGIGNTDNISSICLDDANNPYIMGQFNGTMTVGSFSATASGTSDLFIAKFNSSGGCQWLTTGGSSGNDGSSGSGICYDPIASKIIAGSSYAGTASFGSFNLPFSGGFDLVILEVNPLSGAFINAVGFGTANNDYVYSCVYDVYSGDVLMCGEFNGASITMPGVITLSNAGGIDGWVGRYDASTHAFIWAKPSGGAQTDRANAVITDNSGLAIVVGSFSSAPATFGSFTMSTTNSGGFEDAFVVAYNVKTGNEVWATKNTNTGTQVSNNNMRGLCKIDGGNSYWICGQFSQGFTLGSLAALNAVGFNDFHIGKFSLTVTATTWNGSTWSNGTPTSTIDAIIASSTAPSSFTCKALTINSGAALTTTGITATVNGNITNNGNGIAGTGGLTIAANSTISGSNINFNGTLTVNSGAVLTTGGLLTLTSNATNTARVAVGSSAGGYINGAVKVERYIQGTYRKFRFLGHPFAAAMNITELTDDIDITGAITGTNANGFTSTSTSNPSAFTFTEANGNGAFNDAGWTALTSGNSVSTIAQGQGIRILVRGTKGQTNSLNGGVYTPAAVTLDMTGSLKQGDFTQSLNFTSAAKGWNLIANPYASNIDWTVVTKTNVNNAVYVYKPSGSVYASWVNGSSTNGGSNIIEAGNAFFVRTNAASPSLGWHETDKVATAQPITMFRTNNQITNRLSLTLKNETTQSEDEVVLRFGDDPATNGFDKAYDAENIIASAHDLYVLDKQQTKYSIYHGTALDDWQIESRSIPLGFTVSAIGIHSLTAKTLNALTNGNKAFIQDAFTGTLTEIKDSTVYYFDVTADASSHGSARFSIAFNPIEKIAPTIRDFSIKLSPNPAKSMVQLTYTQTEALNATVSITNAAGKRVKVIALGNVQYGIENINISNLSKGIYFVQYSNGIETRTEKLIIE